MLLDRSTRNNLSYIGMFAQLLTHIASWLRVEICTQINFRILLHERVIGLHLLGNAHETNLWNLLKLQWCRVQALSDCPLMRPPLGCVEIFTLHPTFHSS